jgi:hypothetical protein
MKCGSRWQYFSILAWCLERVSFWGHPRDVAGTALWTDHGDGLRSTIFVVGHGGRGALGSPRRLKFRRHACRGYEVN